MANANDVGSRLQRGGQTLRVNKVPDRFAVRLKRGATPASVASAYNADHRRKLTRQNLDEFAVDAVDRDATMERVRRGPEVEFASHVYTLENDPTARLYLTDELTAKFKPEVSDDQVEGLTVGLGLELVKAVPGVPRAYVFRVTRQATENPIKIANRLLATGKVEVAEPNLTVPAQSFHTPTDALFAEQWHLQHNGGPFLAAASHIDAVRAWDVTRGERSVIVAVADDSCDLNHADFKGTGKVVAARDLAGHDFEPLPEATDDNHGTACCGVAVAEENGAGVVGVAPGCALMPIRTSGSLDDNSIEELFDWVVQHGAAVVSCSWGPAAIYFPLSLRQESAIHRAATLGRSGRGCVIVFAAGNANRPVNGTVDEKSWPNDLFRGPTQWLDGFVTHPDVICVAASTSLAKKSAYSNWGREISVCAPSNNGHPQFYYVGVGPMLTYPHVTGALPGRGVVTADRVGPSGYDSSDYTRDFGGTSSACPTVAGVAALVLSANPALTAVEVKQILESTADKIPDANADPQLGQKLGTYDQNGHSQWFGHGKVNAFRAVTEAAHRGAGAAGQTFKKASTPGVNIPDNTAAGVRDTINFTDAATIAAVNVKLDVTHSYIGDLRVTLTAPSGASALLHDRNGGNAHDLRRTFDDSTTPALGALAGQSLQGNWTLQIQDLAAVDVGRLHTWELEITGQANAGVELGEAPGIAIPDNAAAGIERTLAVQAAGRLKDLTVSVDVTHTYVGDLIITLVAPSGTAVPLHNRGGGSADNVIKDYTLAGTPALQALRGQNIQGAWKLKVADREALDIGKLNRWSLRITRE